VNDIESLPKNRPFFYRELDGVQTEGNRWRLARRKRDVIVRGKRRLIVIILVDVNRMTKVDEDEWEGSTVELREMLDRFIVGIKG
jgi:hypothetical protein